jgi:hypothetical protein
MGAVTNQPDVVRTTQVLGTVQKRRVMVGLKETQHRGTVKMPAATAQHAVKYQSGGFATSIQLI